MSNPIVGKIIRKSERWSHHGKKKPRFTMNIESIRRAKSLCELRERVADAIEEVLHARRMRSSYFKTDREKGNRP